MDLEVKKETEIERRHDMRALNLNIINLTMAINDLRKDYCQNKIDIDKHSNTLYGQECRGGIVQELEILKTTLDNIKWFLNFTGFSFLFTSILLLIKFLKDILK